MSNNTIKYPGKKFREFFDFEIEKYESEVKKDPENAKNQVGLAESYINSWCYGFLSRDESLPTAKSAAITSVELDQNSAAAHTVLGIIKITDWDWAGAEQELKHGVELDPDSYKSRHWYSLFLSAMGRHKEAIHEAQIADSKKLPAGSKIGYGSILYFAHDFEKMVDLLEEAILEEPDTAPLYDWLGMAYVQLKQYDKSIEVYRKAAELSDGLAEIMAGLGHAYGMAGRHDEAHGVLDEMLAAANKWYVPPVQIAFVCLSIGDMDQAYSFLEKAYRERSWELAFMREEPWLDNLHSDKRFLDIMKRLNFPPK
jgi:tetratricopeptide (TPR) repeat protein